MLHYLAQRDGISVDHVLTPELEDLACVPAEELRAEAPGFALATGWAWES